MATFFTKLPSTSSLFSLYTSFNAFVYLLKSIINNILPEHIQTLIVSRFKNYFSAYFSSKFTFTIQEASANGENQIFRAAQVYLPTLLPKITTDNVLISSSNLKDPSAKPNYEIPTEAKIVDVFEGIRLEWTLLSTTNNDDPERYYQLTCKKEFRDKIMSDYFAHIAKSSINISEESSLKIHTYIPNSFSGWQATTFQHNTTFETLAIEPELKKTLISDLDAFLKRKEFFKSVGRAWKRGYLLYGPPGTGKSSLVAAIANYMSYNIYDLQLQSIEDDAELRQILRKTQNRSILLIEDIDCSGTDASCRNEKKEGEDVDKKKEKKVTLSGLLNFVDGLWSSCVEERIIIFTTNHIEKLDPALLRPGRMDKHVFMGYCTGYVFKKLVAMYLGIKEHHLFESIKKMIGEVNVTPAEVTEKLMDSEGPDVTLKSLLEFLETKKGTKESEEADKVGEA